MGEQFPIRVFISVPIALEVAANTIMKSVDPDPSAGMDSFCQPAALAEAPLVATHRICKCCMTVEMWNVMLPQMSALAGVQIYAWNWLTDQPIYGNCKSYSEAYTASGKVVKHPDIIGAASAAAEAKAEQALGDLKGE